MRSTVIWTLLLSVIIFTMISAPITIAAERITGDGRARNPDGGRFDSPGSVDAVTTEQIDLAAGWNLVSLPLDPADHALQSVLASIWEDVGSVWTYDANPGWKRYVVGGPDFLNDLNDMWPGKGYWIYLINAATLVVTGEAAIDTAIQLVPGWNLAGYNSLTALPLADAVASIDGQYNSIWTYVNPPGGTAGIDSSVSAAGTWLRYDPNGPDFLNTLTQTGPWQAFWIDAIASIIWELPSGTTIAVEAGLDTVSMDVGTSNYIAFFVHFTTTETDTFNIEVEQTVSPDDGGITWTSDYPAGGWETNATTSWTINEQIQGNQVGTYEITKRATIIETGDQFEVKVVVNVLSGVEEPQLSPLGSYPDGVAVSVPTDVIFTTTVMGTDLVPTQVLLNQVDGGGGIGIDAVQVLGQLVDDGTDGDLMADDLVYSGTFTINEDAEGFINFQAEATFPGVADPVTSELYPLLITHFPPQLQPPDESKIVVDPGTGEEILSNEVLVTFVDGTDSDTIENIVASIGGSIVGTIPSLGIYQVAILDTGDATGVQNAIAALLTHPEVESAEANSIGELNEVTPNDPSFGTQWGPQKIRADEAWVGYRGAGVTIAVLDTGADYDHPDLNAKVIKGYDFVNSDADPKDDHGHGTHVSGIAAAETNNGTGVAGVGWSSRILAVKVATVNGGVPVGALASGIIYASFRGAKIINMSLRFNSSYASLSLACFIASLRGTLLIAAAGNDSTNATKYPAGYSSVFSVGSTTSTDARSWFSNYGGWVDVAAPGSGILSTMPTYNVTMNNPPSNKAQNYDSLNGTSMASPHVAGAAAVVWAKHPSWSASKVRQRLEKTAKRLPGLQLGHGRIDLFEAIFNGSFEIGDLSEWRSGSVVGTAASITRLGPIVPQHRKRMGYATTGPAGDQVAASVSQHFLIQPSVTNLPITFDYTFVSEEYPEWVGTEFNDSLDIVLVTPAGSTVTLAHEEINAAAFSPIGGIDFPGGDSTTGWTGWKTVHMVIPVTPGTATFRINITDAGDDIYDSAVLIDHIQFK